MTPNPDATALNSRLQPLSAAGLAFVVGGVLAALPGAQSAWTQPEGASFSQVALSQIGPYEKLFQSRGSSFRTGREITEITLELYGEYGLTNDWTLVGNVPLRSVDSGSSISNATIQPVTIGSDTLNSLGNVLLGVRRRFETPHLSVAGQVDLELPSRSSSQGLRTGFDAYTLRPWVSVGQGFGLAYAQAHLGMSLRSNDYSNDWRLGGEVGYQWTQDVLVAGTLDLVESFENGNPDISQRQAETGLYVDEQEYLSLGVKGLFRVTEHVGVSAAVRGAFSGHNVPEVPYLSLGLYFRF